MKAILNSIGALTLGSLVTACAGTTPTNDEAPAAGGSEQSPPASADDGPRAPGEEVVESTHPAGFSCDPIARSETAPLRRLTRRQLEKTVLWLLEYAVDDPTLAAELLESDEVRGAFNRIPEDERQVLPLDLHGSYRRLDQEVQQNQVEAWLALAEAVASQLTQPEWIETVVGSCATDGDADNDDACLADFINNFGERALRRPTTDAENELFTAFFRGPASEEAEAYADVIAGIMSAPQFNYHVEVGDQSVEGAEDVVWLGPYELAARFSYHFWDSPPDEELWSKAEDGTLTDDDVYTVQVDRLLADDRTRETTRQFFLEWLKLERLDDFDNWADSPELAAFAGPNLPSGEFRQAVIEEALDMAQFYTWEEQGALRDLFESTLTFAKTEELAAIYGSSVWDGESGPPELTEPERAGLLTRAALLVTGSDGTRPIMRGVFIRENILCDRIPPPPDNAQDNDLDLDRPLSTRDRIIELTEKEGTSCAGCHTRLINPLGFPLERFDALGRLRDEEIVRDAEGNEVTRFDVNATTTPEIFIGDEVQADGPGELVALINDSGKAEACMARHYFRYSFGRFENVAEDGCMLERLRASLADTGSLAGMLREVALDSTFRQRTLAKGEQ